MKSYLIFGLSVLSDMELEGAYEIDEVNIENADVTIMHEVFDDSYMELTEIEKNNDEVGVLRHYEENWACVRYKKYGVFMIEEGKRIKYNLYPWHDKHFVSQIILCVCMTVLLAQRKVTMIHGSGILYKDRTLIISGDSGAGKSSLANEIMKRNYKQMADDIVAISESETGSVAYPAFPIRKLCIDFINQNGLDKNTMIPMIDEDRDREKYGMILNEEYHNKPEKLGAMVIIKVKEDLMEPELVEVTGADKLKHLTQNFFRKDVYEQVAFTPQEMMKAIKIANEMHIYILNRPANKMTVETQADLIEKII